MTEPLGRAHLHRRLAGVCIAGALIILVLLPTPAFAQAGISLDPAEGEPGDSFVITGEGFGPGELIQLEWDGAKLGDSFFADSDGGFSVTRTVPADAQPEKHTVTATDRPPGQLSASATFTVAGTSATTTTTADATTTTAEDETTTTTSAEAGEEEESQEETTTTEDSSAGPTVGVGATDFEVTPRQASPGDEIEVEANLSGDLRRVVIWLGSTRLGPSVPVGQDGSLQVTRTVPDEVEPGRYLLKLTTVTGRALGRTWFEVTAPDEAVDSDAQNETPSSSLTLGPLEWAILIGIVLLAVLSVWFMWHKPRDEEAPETEKKERWWGRWRKRTGEAEIDAVSTSRAETESRPERPAHEGVPVAEDG